MSDSRKVDQIIEQARAEMKLTLQTFAERLNCKPDALAICEAIENLKAKAARHVAK